MAPPLERILGVTEIVKYRGHQFYIVHDRWEGSSVLVTHTRLSVWVYVVLALKLTCLNVLVFITLIVMISS